MNCAASSPCTRNCNFTDFIGNNRPRSHGSGDGCLHNKANIISIHNSIYVIMYIFSYSMVFYPVADLLKGSMGFLQMLKQSPVRAEGKHEIGPFCGPILGGTDLRL